jgi:protein phosphatase
MTPDCFGLTDPGRRRDTNEDQFLVADLDVPGRVVGSSLRAGELGFLGGRLLAIADGLGGHNGGERASAVAIGAAARHLVEALARPPEFGDADYAAEAAVREAMELAGAEVEQAAAADPNLGGMGTTLTLGLVRWPRLYVAHAGDTRVYVLREGRLWQLTRDHTYAELLASQGRPAPLDAARVLVNCLGGGSPGVVPEVSTFPVWPGDALLLCSDGLHGPVPDSAITHILSTTPTAEAAARELVAAANAAGGPDNVTVVVARFAAGG